MFWKMILSFKLPSKVLYPRWLCSGENDARNPRKESQMKAKLKALTKPSNLTGVFVEITLQATLHEALQQLFFECFSNVF